MKTLKDFTQAAARPLPVILLADISGSMKANGKIDTLNAAVAGMLEDFRQVDDGPGEIQVAVVTFGGGGAKLHLPLQPVSQASWQPLAAEGQTPMGAAFDLARQMIEDRGHIPSRAYQPTIILVSDGEPTDNGAWEPALQQLLQSPRAAKALRMAMAIGEEANLGVLARFLAAPEARVFRAHEVRQIRQFFRWVTMTVTARSRSINPDALATAPMPDPDDVVF